MFFLHSQGHPEPQATLSQGRTSPTPALCCLLDAYSSDTLAWINTLISLMLPSSKQSYKTRSESSCFLSVTVSHTFMMSIIHHSWSVVAERSSLPDSSFGVSSRMWVRIPAVTLLSLSKTLVSTQGLNGYLWGQSWLISPGPICAVMAAIELYTPQGAEMVSGMMYEPYQQG